MESFFLTRYHPKFGIGYCLRQWCNLELKDQNQVFGMELIFCICEGHCSLKFFPVFFCFSFQILSTVVWILILTKVSGFRSHLREVNEFAWEVFSKHNLTRWFVFNWCGAIVTRKNYCYNFRFWSWSRDLILHLLEVLLLYIVYKFVLSNLF